MSARNAVIKAVALRRAVRQTVHGEILHHRLAAEKRPGNGQPADIHQFCVHAYHRYGAPLPSGEAAERAFDRQRVFRNYQPRKRTALRKRIVLNGKQAFRKRQFLKSAAPAEALLGENSEAGICEVQGVESAAC